MSRRVFGVEKRKQSLYFPEQMLEELNVEKIRQDRSLSWLVQQAWRIAREEISKYPSPDDFVKEINP